MHMPMYRYQYVSQNTGFKNMKNVSSRQTNPSIKLWLNFHLLLMESCYLLQPASLLNRLSALFLVYTLGLRHSLTVTQAGVGQLKSGGLMSREVF